jgi:hypothetical protein
MKTILFVLETILSMLIAGVISFIVALILYALLYNGGLFLWYNYL